MEEKNDIKKPPESTPNQTNKKPFSKSFYILISIILIAVVASIAIAGNYYIKQYQLSNYHAPMNIIPTIQFTSPTPTTDPTANWKTYKNKEYGFEFRYPPSFIENINPIVISTKGDELLSLSNGGDNVLKANFLTVIVHPDISDYRLEDQAGGFIFYFNSNKKVWLHEKTDDSSEFIPKRTNVILESYIYKTGDIKCTWDYVLIPNLSYTSMIEIINSRCRDDNGNYLAGYYNLTSDQILSTFKFTDQTTFDKSMILKTFSFTDSKNIIKNLIVVKKFQDKVRAEHADVYLTDKNLSMTSAIRISQLSSEGNSMSRLASSLSDNSAVVSVSSGPGVKFIAVYDRVGDSSQITILDENGKVIKIIGMNTISELIGGKGMFGMQFGEWKDKSSFYVNIGLGNGEAYRALVDANTGNIIGSIQKI